MGAKQGHNEQGDLKNMTCVSAECASKGIAV